MEVKEKHAVIPEFPQIECDLSHYFMENTWNIGEQWFYADPLAHYPSKEQKTVVSILGLEELTNLLLNLDNCKKLAASWSRALENNRYIMYVSANNDFRLLYRLFLKCRRDNTYMFEKVMQKVVQYEYNLNDPCSCPEEILNMLRTAVALDAVVKEAWEREFIFVKLSQNYARLIELTFGCPKKKRKLIKN